MEYLSIMMFVLFLQISLAFHPLSPYFKVIKEDFSYVRQAIDNDSYNPNFLFDSKISGNKAVFLSSKKLVDYTSFSEINELLHLKIFKVDTFLEVTYNGFIQLQSDIIDGFIYWAKIIDVKNLILFINLGYLKIDSYNNTKGSFLNIFKLTEIASGLTLENNIIWLDQPLCILATQEGFFKESENIIYMLINICRDALNHASQRDLIYKQIWKCPINSPFIINSCSKVLIYEEQLSLTDFPGRHLLDKFLAINYSNQIFIGVSERTSFGTQCSNSIIYASINSNGFGPFNFVFPCDDEGENYSYTRFIFILNSGQILNLGFECIPNLFLSSCINSFVTVSLFGQNPFKYNFPKKKIFFNQKYLHIVDAIISINETKLFLLGNLGTYDNHENMISIYSFEISQLNYNDNVDPIPFKGNVYPLLCYKLHEYEVEKFVSHCFTLDFLASGPRKLQEIVYFIEFFDRKFYEKGFFENYSERFYKGSSISNSDLIKYAISSNKFFYLYSYDNINNANLQNPLFDENEVIINSIITLNQFIYYAGCYRVNLFSNYSSIIYILDFSFTIKESAKPFEIPVKNCIKSLLVVKRDFLLISVLSIINNNLPYLASFYLFDSSLIVIRKIIDDSDCFYEEIVMLSNSKKGILLFLSSKDLNSGNRALLIKYFSPDIKLLKEVYLPTKNDAVVNVALLNMYDEISVGGASFISSKSSFWVSFYDKNFQIKSSHFLGKDSSLVTCSTYMDNRILAFSGFINALPMIPKSKYNNHRPSSISSFFSDNGKFIFHKSYNVFSHIIYSTKLNCDKELFGIGIQYQEAISKTVIKFNIICPSNSYIYDMIENGCFKNCQDFIIKDKVLNCLSSKQGCSSSGTISDNYVCHNDKLINTIIMEQIPIVLKAKFINSNNVILESNQDVNSISNQLQISVLKEGKTYFPLKFKILNYVNNFKTLKIKFFDKNEINCISLMTFDIRKMGITSLFFDNKPKQDILVSNINFTECNNEISEFSQAIISASLLTINTLATISIAGNVISLNPLGIINLINSINELLTFQLLNCAPIYPKNINLFLKTTSLFSFDFVVKNNLLDYFVSKENLSNENWFDNNIGSHNALATTSFLYNSFPLLLPIFIYPILFFLLSLFSFSGKIIRKIESYFGYKNLFALYLGIYYELAIISLGGIFDDQLMINYLSFISNLLSFVFITLQIIFLLYSIRQIRKNKMKLDNPEFEDLFSIMYEEAITEEPFIYSNIIANLKLQFLLLIAFTFQNFPIVCISFFILIYFTTFIISLNFNPFENLSVKIKYIINEFILLLLSISFLIYYFCEKIFLKLELGRSAILSNLREILLLEIVISLLNQFIFSFPYLFVIEIIKNLAIFLLKLFHKASESNTPLKSNVMKLFFQNISKEIFFSNHYRTLNFPKFNWNNNLKVGSKNKNFISQNSLNNIFSYNQRKRIDLLQIQKANNFREKDTNQKMIHKEKDEFKEEEKESEQNSIKKLETVPFQNINQKIIFELEKLKIEYPNIFNSVSELEKTKELEKLEKLEKLEYQKNEQYKEEEEEEKEPKSKNIQNLTNDFYQSSKINTGKIKDAENRFEELKQQIISNLNGPSSSFSDTPNVKNNLSMLINSYGPNQFSDLIRNTSLKEIKQILLEINKSKNMLSQNEIQPNRKFKNFNNPIYSRIKIEEIKNLLESSDSKFQISNKKGIERKPESSNNNFNNEKRRTTFKRVGEEIISSSITELQKHKH